jgi:Fe-S-cluster containining protein
MNPYNVDVRDQNLMGPLARLKIIYEDMPPTAGCENCSAVNGEEQKDWCCKTQNPSMYYCEFLYIWQEVQKWPKTRRAWLVLRAIRNYLSNSLSKGCIFYEDSFGCKVYEHRPFMCRMYGVIDPERFQQRFDLLRERQGEKFEAKPQCKLVHVADDQALIPYIKAEDEDKMFQQVMTCEARIGMTEPLLKLHDQPGGPYRTFHDHILIELFPPAFLEMLTKTRMTNPSQEDIDKTIEIVDGILQESGIIK